MAVLAAPSQGRIASLLARLNPIPTFSAYTGPYKVGTMDIEVPVSELPSACPLPQGAASIPTISCRVFYPAVDESKEKPIPWLPTPQRHTISAFGRFMGVGNGVSDFLSFFPLHVFYTSIPAHKNAAMRSAGTESGRWPTMIFSHGLGGSRNTYSYIAGSLASHGVVVFCPEHRDGSAISTHVRVPGQDGRVARKAVPYLQLGHSASTEVYEAREAQLRIRLWELGLLFEAILAMDSGDHLTNLNTSTPSLNQFVGRLNVKEPGSVIFAGHSFGASTMHQLLKSTYYARHPQVVGMKKPLFAPSEESNIRKQITERTVTMLLDMWCLPLAGPDSAPLFNLPLPLYDDVPSAPGGSALLAVESEDFYKWSEHLNVKARLLSPDPTAEIVTSAVFERPSGRRVSEPNFFYVRSSAHLNQSDFAVLFPWITKKIFSASEPERALRLNLRAQLQLLRINGIPIANTSASDLVEGTHVDKLEVPSVSSKDAMTTIAEGLNNDEAIFYRRTDGIVNHWQWIDTIGMGGVQKEEGEVPPQEQIVVEAQMEADLQAHLSEMVAARG